MKEKTEELNGDEFSIVVEKFNSFVTSYENKFTLNATKEIIQISVMVEGFNNEFKK